MVRQSSPSLLCDASRKVPTLPQANCLEPSYDRAYYGTPFCLVVLYWVYLFPAQLPTTLVLSARILACGRNHPDCGVFRRSFVRIHSQYRDRDIGSVGHCVPFCPTHFGDYETSGFLGDIACRNSCYTCVLCAYFL